MKKVKVGINGFGRFGLHLLKYWLDRADKSNFIISYINDDFLKISDVLKIITEDKAVIFNKYKVTIVKNCLSIIEPNGERYIIEFSNKNMPEAPWRGMPEILLECSGKGTVAKDSQALLSGNTRLVVISATSWDSEKTLIFGFNQKEYKNNMKVISYGSCTVNAYIPLANYLNERYGVTESDVNVIHNIQKYRLHEFNTLNRKFCTLEKSALNLLKFLNENNFLVNYTVIPYSGVSMLDFRFKLKSKVNKENVIEDLSEAFINGRLNGLYDFSEFDVGPEVYNCSTYSAVFIKENVKVLKNNIYLQGYFDNENSVNRYYDLVNYICSK